MQLTATIKKLSIVWMIYFIFTNSLQAAPITDLLANLAHSPQGQHLLQTQLGSINIPNEILSIFANGNNLALNTSEGMFYSADKGITWTKPSLPDSKSSGNYQMHSADGLIYLASNQGLYVSSNDAQTWQLLLAQAGITHFAVQNKDIFVATSNSVFVSHDRGATWHPTSAPGAYLNNINMITGSGQNICVGTTLGKPNYGVYISHDDGATWTNTLGSDQVQIKGIAFFKDMIYSVGNMVGADGWYEIRPIDGKVVSEKSFAPNSFNYFFPTTSELYVGLDNGFYAFHQGDLALLYNTPSNTVAIDNNDLYLGVAGILYHGELNNPQYPLQKITYALQVNTIAQTSDNTLFVATSDGLNIEIPSGTWSKTLSGKNVQQIVLDQAPNSQILYAITDQAVYISKDSGNTWNTFFVTPSVHVQSFYANNNNLVVSEIDENHHSSTIFSLDGGKTWAPSTFSVPNNYSFYTIIQHNQTLYAGCDGGILMSQDQGRSWQWLNTGTGTVNYVFSLYIDANHHFFAGTAGNLLISNDQGQSFQPVPQISGIITQVTGKNNQLGLIGRTTNAVSISNDGGNNWQDSAPLPSAVVSIYMSGQTLYAGTANNGLFESNDEGMTWNKIL